MESQLAVWTVKAIFKWLVTAAINYNCELLLSTVTKLCSMSLPPFIPIMAALMIKSSPANAGDTRPQVPSLGQEDP